MTTRLFLIFGIFLSALALSCAGHKSGEIRATADLATPPADSAAAQVSAPLPAGRQAGKEEASPAKTAQPAAATTSRAAEAPAISSTEAKPLVQFLEAATGDSQAETGRRENETTDGKTGEVSPSPSGAGQYLLIRFHQNDTDVEMVIDPHTTNLNLDLVRGADGTMEISRGDSVLYKKDEPAEKAESGDELAATKGKNLDEKTLTDDIIGDINLAQKMFYEHKYDEALQVLQQSLQKKRTATAYALGGSIYYVSGDMDAAVSAWENALKINPNLPQVRELVLRYKK